MPYGPSEGPTNVTEDFLNAVEALETHLQEIKRQFCGEIDKEKFGITMSEIVQHIDFMERTVDDACKLQNEMINE